MSKIENYKTPLKSKLKTGNNYYEDMTTGAQTERYE